MDDYIPTYRQHHSTLLPGHPSAPCSSQTRRRFRHGPLVGIYRVAHLNIVGIDEAFDEHDRDENAESGEGRVPRDGPPSGLALNGDGVGLCRRGLNVVGRRLLGEKGLSLVDAGDDGDGVGFWWRWRCRWPRRVLKGGGYIVCEWIAFSDGQKIAVSMRKLQGEVKWK